MEITGEMNIQQINEACLSEYFSWGKTHIVDICSAEIDVITWGFLDYFMPLFMFFVFVNILFAFEYNF